LTLLAPLCPFFLALFSISLSAASLPPDLGQVDASWHALLLRMDADKIYGPDVESWFIRLPEKFSSRPMGIKARLFFRQRFLPAPPTPSPGSLPEPSVYPGVVTADNMLKCRAFLKEHAGLFQAAEQLYAVPQEVLVSLLMVESRLGDFLGKENAFWVLACMAAADKPERVMDHLQDLPLDSAREKWLRELLAARSARAYAELKALILYCRRHGHNPLELPGSVYGAIGLCQFMPSNIEFYAVDGDGDGRIDLFSLADALSSAANFLKAHGWRKSSPLSTHSRLLRYYNNSEIYSNTVLALASGVREEGNPGEGGSTPPGETAEKR
jgi:membrane-bound lytic murein transglycosylase B